METFPEGPPPPPSAEGQPQELGPTALHREIVDKWRSSAFERKEREAEWVIQREFLAGNQYATYSRARGMINRPMDEGVNRKPRMVYNYSRVVVETIVANLLRKAPIFQARANRGDPKSQAAGVLGRQLLRYYWEYLDLPELIEETAFWVFSAGAAFWEIGWDPKAGEQYPVQTPMADPASMLAQMLGMGAPQMQMQTQMVPSGDVYVRLRSPFEVYPDPGARNLKTARWCITGTMRPLEEVQELYPEAAQWVQVADTRMNGETTQAAQVLTEFGSDSRGIGRDKLNRCLVLEYWGRPTAKHPQGLHVVATQAGILQSGPTPEGHDAIPLAMWTDRVIPGRFWPDATMRDLVPMQRELNRRLSQLIDITNKYRTKWLAAAGTLDEQQLTDEEGEVLEFQPGGPRPEAVPPPPIPDGPIKILNFAKAGMEDASGANRAVQGQVEGEQRSGRQVAYLQQAAEGRLSLFASHLARFLSRSGKLVLELIRVNVREPRIARIAGANRTEQIRLFTGADIEGVTDVTVEPGSLLGFTMAERFDKTMQLVDKGLLQADQALESLELQDYYPYTDEIATDRNNAMAEEEMWRQGDYSQAPFYFDDHHVHLATHNLFRKGPDYRAMDPARRQGVDAHCQVHEQYVLGKAAQPGGAAPGGPTPPGEAMPPGATPALPGQPPSPQEAAASVKESGQELAQGLPPVPAVRPVGPDH